MNGNVLNVINKKMDRVALNKNIYAYETIFRHEPIA